MICGLLVNGFAVLHFDEERLMQNVSCLTQNIGAQRNLKYYMKPHQLQFYVKHVSICYRLMGKIKDGQKDYHSSKPNIQPCRLKKKAAADFCIKKLIGQRYTFHQWFPFFGKFSWQGCFNVNITFVAMEGIALNTST